MRVGLWRNRAKPIPSVVIQFGFWAPAGVVAFVYAVVGGATRRRDCRSSAVTLLAMLSAISHKAGT